MRFLFSILLQYQNLPQPVLHNLFPCMWVLKKKMLIANVLSHQQEFWEVLRRLWCGKLESQRTKTAYNDKTMVRSPTPAVDPGRTCLPENPWTLGSLLQCRKPQHWRTKMMSRTHKKTPWIGEECMSPFYSDPVNFTFEVLLIFIGTVDFRILKALLSSLGSQDI